MADNELIRRAIAKEKGIPYEPMQSSADGVSPVDRALESFDASRVDLAGAGVDSAPVVQEPAAAIEPPASAVTPPPVDDELRGAPAATANPYGSEIVRRAIAKEKGQPYDTPGDVARVVEPKQVVRTIEPKAEAVPGGETAAEVPPAASAEPSEPASLSLQPTVQSAQSDAAKILADNEEAMSGIADAEAAHAKAKAERGKAFLADYDALEKEYGDKEKAALAGIKKLQDEYGALNDEIRQLPPIQDRRSGFDKFIGGIGVGIGQMVDQNNLVAGLMQGMNVQTHNADAIQGQINQNAERDIALQRENNNNARKNADAKMNELALAQQYLGDTQQAHRFAVALRKDRNAAEMDVAADELASKTARDQMRLEIGKTRAAARKEMNDILQTEMGAKAAAFQAIALGKMTPEQAASFIGNLGGSAAGGPTKAEVKAAKGAESINKSQEQLAQGYHEAGAKLAPDLYVTDPEIWNRKKTEIKQKELDIDYQSRQLRRQLAGVHAYIEANPGYASDMDKRAVLENKVGNVLTTYKNAADLGSLDNGVERVVKKVTGDPNGTVDSVLDFIGKKPTALATLANEIAEVDTAILERRANNGLGNTPAPNPAESAAPEKPSRPVAAKAPAPAPAKPAAPAPPAKRPPVLSPEDL